MMGDRYTTQLLWLLVVGVCGCSPWIRPPSDDKVLPSPAMSSDSAVLEIAFVHLTPDDKEVEAATWRQLDEQAISLETRRGLASNGLRAAVAGTQLPQELRNLVERTTKELAQAPAGDDVTAAETASLSRQRRLQVRAGRRGKVVVSTTLPSISVLAKDNDGRVHGESYRDAQCLLSLKAFPEGDGRTRLQLTPEIEHGDLKNRWVPVDGALVQQVGKERQVYDRLQIDLHLAAGQTLVLGPTEDVSGLGQHFFTLTNPTPRHTLLLVRLAQTQQDDLFQKEQKSAELMSSVD